MDTTGNSGNEIRLQATIDQVNSTRANDSGFADGDYIGIYAVSFTDNGNPGVLSSSENLATNVRFSFEENSYKWTGDRQLYFKDDKTPVDFYGYYPFVSNIEDVNAFTFNVQKNQSKEAINGSLSGLEASDFLWAKTPAVTPSSSIVFLTFKHILASVRVLLIEGTGFSEGEWLETDKMVIVSNTNLNSTIDLTSGKTTMIEGTASNIIACKQNNDYRAIVIPQTVESGKTLLTFTIGGKNYEFKKNEIMTFIPSKMHKFTIEVNKSQSTGDYELKLLDESITAWESDLESHNGKVKEYIVVDVPQAGGLESAINNLKLDPTDIINLKVTGELTSSDFKYLRNNFTYLEALNLKDVSLKSCGIDYYGDFDFLSDNTLPYQACKEMLYLSSVVFPDKLCKIGEEAFRNTNLTGSLVFPEGLEYIGGSAFSNWQAYTTSNTNLSGTLTLPSTLKYIGGSAFENCDFTGELVLPEGLEYIGASAFADCEFMTGELHLPHTLKEIGTRAFANMKGLRGNLELPHHLTEVIPIGAPNLRRVFFPDAPTKIASEAFWNCRISGDIIIPETVTQIGSMAFCGTDISHIIFPKKLEFIEDNVCSNNKNLQDTVIIPPLIETIGERAFAECEKLEAVILPKNLQRIKGSAFENCFTLNYIHCQAIEPPALDESAFYGVAKDNFTLEVPEESVDAYRQAPGWREFKRIASYRNFVARPSKYNVLNNGGEKEIILNADSDWELAECPSWCHIDRKSGSKKTTLKLTVDKMGHGQPDRTGIISFKLKDSDEHVTHINIGQYDYQYDEDQYVQLQKSTKGLGIDLFFVGDGYDAIDISKNLYLDDMKQEMEYLFAVEPYTTYRDYFNVYTSIALSEDSGVESINQWRTTKFHSKIMNSDIRLESDWSSAMDYCAKTVPPIMNKPNPNGFVILLLNTDLYEGLTVSLGDSFCAIVTKSGLEYPYDARGVVQHEAGGHGLGWLADEYIYHQAFIDKCVCSCCAHSDGLRSDHSWGFGLNLSLNGRYKDVPWSHLIFNPNYGDIVDIYDGGYFHSRGVYRSEYNSCMNNNVPYFSTWSRQLIVQRIMKFAGEEFTIDKFYANDKRDMGKDFTGTRSTTYNTQTSFHGNPPIFIKNYQFGKKGGRK